MGFRVMHLRRRELARAVEISKSLAALCQLHILWNLVNSVSWKRHSYYIPCLLRWMRSPYHMHDDYSLILQENFISLLYSRIAGLELRIE